MYRHAARAAKTPPPHASCQRRLAWAPHTSAHHLLLSPPRAAAPHTLNLHHCISLHAIIASRTLSHRRPARKGWNTTPLHTYTWRCATQDGAAQQRKTSRQARGKGITRLYTASPAPAPRYEHGAAAYSFFLAVLHASLLSIATASISLRSVPSSVYISLSGALNMARAVAAVCTLYGMLRSFIIAPITSI